MKRHDTHNLSEESENEDQKKDDEDGHEYTFNTESNYSFDDSSKKFFSKESVESKTSQNILNNINFDDNYDDNEIQEEKKEISLISSKDLENPFYNESAKKNEGVPPKKLKFRKKRNFVKLRKFKLNKESRDEIIENYFTYHPWIDDRDEKNDNKERKCVSLSNTNKNYEMDTNGGITRKKKKKEKEVLYFFYNNDIEGRQKIRNMMYIINNQKMKFWKISHNNNFGLNIKKKKKKKKNKLPSINKNKFIDLNIDNNEREIRKRKTLYSKLVYELNTSKFNKNKKLLLFNIYKPGTKSTNNNNCDNNSNLKENVSNKLLLKSNNNSQVKETLWKTANQSLSLKTKKFSEKESRLYNLYYKNDSKKRMRSTESLLGAKKLEKEKNREILLKLKDNHKFFDMKNKFNRELIKSIFKVNFRKKCYEKHYGTNTNCPWCNAMKTKNEKNIIKKGILFNVSSAGTDTCQSSCLKNRRVYSAKARLLFNPNRNTNNDNNNERAGSKSRSKSRSRSKNSSMSKNISSIQNYKYKTNKSKITINSINSTNKNGFINSEKLKYRKLNINRPFSKKK